MRTARISCASSPSFRSSTRRTISARDSLTACGRQSTRNTVQSCATALMVFLCLVLIPRYGAMGAAIANVCSHATMAAGMWAAILFHRRREGILRVPGLGVTVGEVTGFSQRYHSAVALESVAS